MSKGEGVKKVERRLASDKKILNFSICNLLILNVSCLTYELTHWKISCKDVVCV